MIGVENMYHYTYASSILHNYSLLILVLHISFSTSPPHPSNLSHPALTNEYMPSNLAPTPTFRTQCHITPIQATHTPQSTIHLSQSHPHTPTLIPDTPNTAQSSPGRLYKRSRLWLNCSDTKDTILASPVPLTPPLPPPRLSRLPAFVSMCVRVSLISSSDCGGRTSNSPFHLSLENETSHFTCREKHVGFIPVSVAWNAMTGRVVVLLMLLLLRRCCLWRCYGGRVLCRTVGVTVWMLQ